MFLYRRAWQVEHCLFNLLNTQHAADYNALLTWIGRGINILERKLQIVTGFAAPDFEAGPDEHGNIPTRIKDDAAYMFVRYERSPACPFHPVWKADRSSLAAFGVEGDPDAPKADLPPWEGGEEDDEEHIVIAAPPPKPPKKGVDKVVAKAKETIAKATRNQLGVDLAGVPDEMLELVGRDNVTAVKKERDGSVTLSVGGKPVADLTAKRVAKAKTIDEKVTIAADAAVREIDAIVKASAGKLAKDLVARMSTVPNKDEHLAAFLLGEHERAPKKAEAIFKKILAERPDVAPDVATFLQRLRLTAAGQGRAKKKAAGKAPVAGKKE